MNYKTAVLKRNIEQTVIFPLVFLGKIYGRLFPLKNTYGFFLFSASADIGGATKVNADIASLMKEKNPLVIFSKKTKNKKYLHLFQQNGIHYIDLQKRIDNKWYHFINIFYRGVIAGWINKQHNPVVFGGESIYFYKVIPYIKKQAKIIELCHLNTWLNFSQAYIPYIQYRIFSTKKIKRDAELQYKHNLVPVEYNTKLFFIDNKIEIPNYKENNNEILQVIFVGRGAPQKRVHLIAAIAKRMHEQQEKIHFSFVGDVEKIIIPADYPYCTFYGNVADYNKLKKIYETSDVLLLTSLYEGLPLVVMEMMAHGKVVMSTAVDGIPDYITHLENGILINNDDEQEIINSAVQYLLLLIANRNLLITIGENARNYAINNFSAMVFDEAYKKLLS